MHLIPAECIRVYLSFSSVIVQSMSEWINEWTLHWNSTVGDHSWVQQTTRVFNIIALIIFLRAFFQLPLLFVHDRHSLARERFFITEPFDTHQPHHHWRYHVSLYSWKWINALGSLMVISYFNIYLLLQSASDQRHQDRINNNNWRVWMTSTNPQIPLIDTFCDFLGML